MLPAPVPASVHAPVHAPPHAPVRLEALAPGTTHAPARSKDNMISMVLITMLLGLAIAILVWQMLRIDERVTCLEKENRRAHPAPPSCRIPVAKEEEEPDDYDDEECVEETNDVLLESNAQDNDEEEEPPPSASV